MASTRNITLKDPSETAFPIATSRSNFYMPKLFPTIISTTF